MDDKQIVSYTKGDPYVDNANEHQNIQFNMWAPRYDAHPVDWSKGRDDASFPWYAKLDWLEYSSYDAHTDDFSMAWHDSFDWLDQSRWAVADNMGWDQNLSTYMASQVYVEDG